VLIFERLFPRIHQSANWLTANCLANSLHVRHFNITFSFDLQNYCVDTLHSAVYFTAERLWLLRCISFRYYYRYLLLISWVTRICLILIDQEVSVCLIQLACASNARRIFVVPALMSNSI